MFELNLSESFTITKKGDSSVYVGLTRVEAEHLWAALGLALFPNKTGKWNVGDVIPANSDEPDLPIGSEIEDDSVYKDRAVRVEDGWKWITLLGSPTNDGVWPWGSWCEQTWTVTRVGK